MSRVDYTRPFKFTKGSINGIPQGDILGYFYDTEIPRLGITRQLSGNLNFHVRKVVKGKTQRISLEQGRWPDMSVSMAREKATEMLADIIRGADPVKKKSREREAKAVSGLTVEQATEAYLEGKRTGKQKLELKPRTKKGYREAIRFLLKDDYQSALISITEDTIDKRMKKATNAQGANACRSLSAVWNWQRKQKGNRGLIGENPVKLYAEAQDGLFVPQPRKNYIKEDYLPDWFDAVEELPTVASEFMLFLILTGVRLNEARNLEWKDVDFKTNLYTLNDTKNRNTVELPLPRYLKDRLLTRKAKSGLVFPVHARHHQTVAEAIDYKFTNHDLRRTFSSYGYQVCDYTKVEMLTNHIVSGVTADYIQVSPDALAKEHRKVEGHILSLAGRSLPSNVAKLRAVK